MWTLRRPKVARGEKNWKSEDRLVRLDLCPQSTFIVRDVKVCWAFLAVHLFIMRVEGWKKGGDPEFILNERPPLWPSTNSTDLAHVSPIWTEKLPGCCFIGWRWDIKGNAARGHGCFYLSCYEYVSRRPEQA